MHEWVHLHRPNARGASGVNPALIGGAVAVMRDVQAETDARGIAIDQVGIRSLRYPILVSTLDGQQHSIATWELTVELSAEQRGTHMSRLVETLESRRQVPLDGPKMMTLLAELRDRLSTPKTEAICAFTMFLERHAPVTGMSAQHAIDCTFRGLSSVDEQCLALQVRVPVTTLCPCSKEISDYGAHNQRGYVDITAATRPASDLTFYDLIAIAEQSASAPIYPLLKRVDERHVTMQAYDAPTFVEDVVRNAATALIKDQRVDGFKAEAENHESIHDHAAVARVTWERS
jgi:GTP cyclohydrolase I